MAHNPFIKMLFAHPITKTTLDIFVQHLLDFDIISYAFSQFFDCQIAHKCCNYIAGSLAAICDRSFTFWDMPMDSTRAPPFRNFG